MMGDRWTLLVLRDLMFVRKRYFREFLESPEKIASNILTDRLRQLEAAGLVTRRHDPEHGRQVIYEPTPKALDLLPAMLELVRWGLAHTPRSSAPPALVRRVRQDRNALAAEMKAALARGAAPFATKAAAGKR